MACRIQVLLVPTHSVPTKVTCHTHKFFFKIFSSQEKTLDFPNVMERLFIVKLETQNSLLDSLLDSKGVDLE